MLDEVQWLIGVAVTVSIAWTGALIGAFWKIVAMIKRVETKSSASVAVLHSRVDDVKERYVRRDDLDGHLSRMDKKMDDIRSEMRINHQQVIDALNKRPD